MCHPSVRKHQRDEEMRNPETKDLALLSNRLGRAELQNQTFGGLRVSPLTPWCR
ncbi:mCG1028297, isoform CRA_c [Mus musculus]|nr:mCG1028297, isoform CRA_c [Mus musculus]